MSIELIERARRHSSRVAIVDARGEHTYDALLTASHHNAAALTGRAHQDLLEAPVAFMVSPGFEYAAVQWGIWRAGGIAVPLCLSHPAPELDYVLADTHAQFIIVDDANRERLEPLARARHARLLTTTDALQSVAIDLPAIDSTRRAMILYTSGTTDRPKGVITTHDNLRAQVESLFEAWEWRSDDRILHVLPLHHTHGIVNVLLCALWSGAVCEMPHSFDALRVWDRLLAGGLTLFMAVPTIYVKLIAAYDSAPEGLQRQMRECLRPLRLMVSGSAALPVSTFARWQEISGQALLERYGMTEIGMALSNPLYGERRPGTVGQPLPGVEVRLLGEDGIVLEEGTPGMIQVRGAGVFTEYWERPEATRLGFSDGRWFRTGDVAVIENGYYRILGRSNIDIIKTGGYKISALEIEEVLRTHPDVHDCAVVGIEDAEWGERVCAAIVGSKTDERELQAWLAERLAPYKLPRRWLQVDELPRNVMGKVTKQDVKRLFA
ncbi:MAG: acyl-CoA synthetase [Gemmatimonadota bacterium]